MMDHRTAIETAKGMLVDGKLPDVAAANVAIVKLMGVLAVGSLPREVRSAYLAAVKAGELGRLPKKHLAPEIFFHKNARGTAIALQERLFRKAVEALKGVYATPNHVIEEEALHG
jgi:collagenase-like PrtC family protease